MGYDLHITRRERWPGSGDEISAEEWLAFVAQSADFTLASEQGPYFAVWSGPSALPDPWLDWWEGCITTKNPDRPLIERMVQIASQLGARVQGDDGEIYGPDGEAEEEESHSLLPVWVRRLLRWR